MRAVPLSPAVARNGADGRWLSAITRETTEELISKNIRFQFLSTSLDLKFFQTRRSGNIACECKQYWVTIPLASFTQTPIIMAIGGAFIGMVSLAIRREW